MVLPMLFIAPTQEHDKNDIGIHVVTSVYLFEGLGWVAFKIFSAQQKRLENVLQGEQWGKKIGQVLPTIRVLSLVFTSDVSITASTRIKIFPFPCACAYAYVRLRCACVTSENHALQGYFDVMKNYCTLTKTTMHNFKVRKKIHTP